ncbi:hypothetical protein BH23ACT11_BH23ACT11_17280 [soil metagenome]
MRNWTSRGSLRIIRQNPALTLLTVDALLLGVLFVHFDIAVGMRIQQLAVLLALINRLRLMRT